MEIKSTKKIQETEVKLEDPSGVDEESIMYFWTNSTEPPEKRQIHREI